MLDHSSCSIPSLSPFSFFSAHVWKRPAKTEDRDELDGLSRRYSQDGANVSRVYFKSFIEDL